MRVFLSVLLICVCASVGFGQASGFKADTTVTKYVKPPAGSVLLYLRNQTRVDTFQFNLPIPVGALKESLDAMRERIGTGGGSADVGGIRDTISDIIVDVGDLQTGAIPFVTTDQPYIVQYKADSLRKLIVNSPLQMDNNGLTGLDQMSITHDGFGWKLQGDQQTPGNLKYYGTNSSGVKGYNSFPGLLLALAGYSDTQDGFDYLSPTEATGQMIYNNGTHNVGLDIGTNGYILGVSSGVPAWRASDTVGLAANLFAKALKASPTFTGTITTPLGAGTVRSSSGGVLSVTASDTVGLGTSIAAKVSKTEIYTLPYQVGLASAGVVVGTVWSMGITNGEIVDSVMISNVGGGDGDFNFYTGTVTGTATDSLFTAPQAFDADNRLHGTYRNSGNLGYKYWWFKATVVVGAPTSMAITFKGHRP